MKLARFLYEGSERIGLVVAEGMIDVAKHKPGSFSSMTALLDDWAALGPLLGELQADTPADYPLSSVTLLAPVARPGKIMAIGLNYADHAKEAGMELPKNQMWFTKAVTSITGPFAKVELPKVSSQLDYEAELVMVIGRRCRHVSVEDAASVILGYCVGNDVSVRDWQFHTSQFTIGKSFDTHGPIGPWIVTADAIDPFHLGIRTFVNGEKRQDSNTDQFVFNPFELVAHLSKAMTLEPGDLIFTGTPPGVGAAMKPAQWLGAGDVIRVEIDEIGWIENVVVPEGR